MIINTEFRDVPVAFLIYSRCLKKYISQSIFSRDYERCGDQNEISRGNLIFFASVGVTAVQRWHSSLLHSFRTTAFVVAAAAAAAKRASYVQIETRSASLH